MNLCTNQLFQIARNFPILDCKKLLRLQKNSTINNFSLRNKYTYLNFLYFTLLTIKNSIFNFRETLFIFVYWQSNAKYLKQSLFLSIEPTKAPPPPPPRLLKLAGQYRTKTTLLMGEEVKWLCSNIFCTWL